MYANAHDECESNFKASRWLSALPPAGILTIALLALMVELVVVEMEAPEDIATPKIEFPVYEPNPLLTNLKTALPKKPKVEHPPEIPESQAQETNTHAVTIPVVRAPADFNDNMNMSFTGMPIPQFLASAKYPSRAASRGIEGFVDVRFDITRAGTTDNIAVVSSSPEGVFERAALEAVKRWRYQPKMVEGKPVIYQGMTQRIRFVMQGSQEA